MMNVKDFENQFFFKFPGHHSWNTSWRRWLWQSSFHWCKFLRQCRFHSHVPSCTNQCSYSDYFGDDFVGVLHTYKKILFNLFHRTEASSSFSEKPVIHRRLHGTEWMLLTLQWWPTNPSQTFANKCDQIVECTASSLTVDKRQTLFLNALHWDTLFERPQRPGAVSWIIGL